ncbi:uncharacterized protein TRAVEDRAFT_24436 [Trametes versicolor FP-101664 SS1]|uniref:uncharacterized protein n=1 Tax=Trametes versicolor (strain FP-101664) TaxID=717944 RepID=UPI00046221A4|nr:uncharacterized protein TRAVEDRAFT_24436 [Trametes versicolor FP-101664 SS1]EIW53128.1 hypothetical protein TRAVEDRAFT_24436 [Trametes versicolor FP-101664 SS1]
MLSAPPLIFGPATAPFSVADMNSTTASDQAAAAVEIAAYISELDFNVMQGYCTTSAIALLANHYITTLDDEVTHLWGKAVAQKGRITLAWILFFGNRYLPLVVYAYQAPWWPEHRYNGYIPEYLQYGLWAAIASLRAYAVSRRKLLAVLVFLLGLIPIFCSIDVFAKYVTPKIGPVNGCTPDTSRLPFEVYEISSVFGYSSWFLSEVLVVGVTLSATYHYTALAGTTGHGRTHSRGATAVVTSMDINTNNSIGMERASRPADLDIQFAQVSDAGEDEEALHNDMHV